MAESSRESKLDAYRAEILSLRLEHRYTLADIVKHLNAQHQVSVSNSTLSNYIKQHEKTLPPPAPEESRVSPEEERFFEQAEVYQALQQTIADIGQVVAETGQRIDQLTDGVRALNREGNERHNAMLAAFKQGSHSANSPEDSGAIQTQLQKIHDRINTVPLSTMRRVYRRALLWSGLVWGMALIFIWPWIKGLSDWVWSLF